MYKCALLCSLSFLFFFVEGEMALALVVFSEVCLPCWACFRL